MKTNDYKSGKVANMIGASHETLRFYHNNNIFTAKKKGESIYDIYSDHDIASLYNLRSYKNYGISVKECGQIIKKQNKNSVEKVFSNIEYLLEKESAYNNLLIKHYKRHKKWNENIETNFHVITNDKMPCMYLFNVENSNELTKQEVKILKELASLTPIVMPINVLDVSYLNNTFKETGYKMGILEEDFEYFDKYYNLNSLKEKNVFEKINVNNNMQSIIRINLPTTYDENALSYIINYININNIKVQPKLYGSIISVNYCSMDNENLNDYYIIWIPIED